MPRQKVKGLIAIIGYKSFRCSLLKIAIFFLKKIAQRLLKSVNSISVVFKINLR